MSRLLETKKKKELKSRGNESHFFLSSQSFPKAKILSQSQRSGRFNIFRKYIVQRRPSMMSQRKPLGSQPQGCLG